jgi:hypothetical protein
MVIEGPYRVPYCLEAEREDMGSYGYYYYYLNERE